MKEHKPCPFCGSIDISPEQYDLFVLIHCNDCHAEGPIVLITDHPDDHTAIAEAYRLWDQRWETSEE